MLRLPVCGGFFGNKERELICTATEAQARAKPFHTQFP